MHVTGCVFLLACATLLAQDCPPERFDYDYGPPCAYADVAAMVMNHYGVDGPVVPLAADYARACRDVGLIRAAVPILESHHQLWPDRWLNIKTREPANPQLVCTNQYYGATMGEIFYPGSNSWLVGFPTAVNIPALVQIYQALPGVFAAYRDGYDCFECCAFPQWLYSEQPDGAWRWSILDDSYWGPGSALWNIEVSVAGQLTVLVDDFDAGEAIGWTPLDFTSGLPYGPGVFDASSGDYRLSTTGSVPIGDTATVLSTWDASGDWFYSNGCVRAKIRSESPNSNAFIAMHATNEGNGYFYGGMPSTGQFFIQADPEATIFAGLAGQPYDLNQDWVLEACAIDDLLTLKAWRDGEPEPGEPLISLQDTTRSSGLIAVGGAHQPGVASPITVSFDDIFFVPPSQAGRPSWFGLGTGIDGSVRALVVLPNGDLVAGGEFTTAGDFSANNIARWDGCGWSPLETGIDGSVRALAVLPNGDLVAGGYFTAAGGVPANNTARWDGSAWSVLGAGMNGQVSALAVLPNGDLVAGGSFSTAGGVPASNIARWDGSEWSSLGVGIEGGWCSSPVSALAVLPNGDLVAGGSFITAGDAPANRIALWDGNTWSPMGTGMDGEVSALAVLPNGELVAGGRFSSANIARWDGTQWDALQNGVSRTSCAFSVPWCIEHFVNALAVYDGHLIAGGNFNAAAGGSASNLARWDGKALFGLWPGTNGTVSALAVLPNGELVAGGSFTRAGSESANHIARWGLPEQEVDDDGVLAGCDNCPGVANSDQFDTDADGVGDACDACADSNLSATVVIGDCDTDIANLLLDDGCTMADWITLAAAQSTNHGAFASSVAHLGNDWKNAGLITAEEKDRLQECAAGAR